MSCGECGGEVRQERGDHKYRVSSGDVVLSDIQLERCVSCGSVEVVVPNVAGLHRAIDLAQSIKRSS